MDYKYNIDKWFELHKAKWTYGPLAIELSVKNYEPEYGETLHCCITKFNEQVVRKQKEFR